MSAVSLADINATVRFRGGFRNAQRFPDTNLNGEIQAAWKELYELIADTQQGYWDTKGIVPTIAGQDFVGLPADAWRVRKISRLDGNDYIPMDQIGIDDADRYGSTRGRPSAYTLTARGADLFRTPDAVYTLRVIYTPIAQTLSAAREYYNGWEEYVIYGALARLSQNEERSSPWDTQLAFQRARIMRGASDRKAQEPEYLPLRDGFSDLDRDERWR